MNVQMKKSTLAVSKIFKAAALTQIINTEEVCANRTNPIDILQGGRLVQWMDIAAATCAQTHAGTTCVTSLINKVSFMHPSRVGDSVTIKARITSAFATSMEIRVQAWTQSVGKVVKEKLSESYFTFVALDEKSNPTDVKSVSAEKKKLFLNARKGKSN